MVDSFRYSTILIALLFGIVLLLLTDVFFDLREGTTWLHVMAEILAFIGASCALAIVAKTSLDGMRSHVSALERDLARLKSERHAWREKAQSLLKGLGEVIDQQFDAWQYSGAEKDVALLILKGLSHKEIATLRGTAEKTVRHQASMVYAKSGLDGKAQLAAFFLEDLLLPVHS